MNRVVAKIRNFFQFKTKKEALTKIISMIIIVWFLFIASMRIYHLIDLNNDLKDLTDQIQTTDKNTISKKINFNPFSTVPYSKITIKGTLATVDSKTSALNSVENFSFDLTKIMIKPIIEASIRSLEDKLKKVTKQITVIIDDETMATIKF